MTLSEIFGTNHGIIVVFRAKEGEEKNRKDTQHHLGRMQDPSKFALSHIQQKLHFSHS